MTKGQIRNILMTLGVLDLVSFFRTYEMGLSMWADIFSTLDTDMELWNKILRLGLSISGLTLVLLLFASGLFLILGKRTGIIIYYFEFPLRLMFLTLTFGFVLRLLGLQVDTWTYKIAMAFIVGLELFRLIFSIWTQRKHFNAGQTASP